MRFNPLNKPLKCENIMLREKNSNTQTQLFFSKLLMWVLGRGGQLKYWYICNKTITSGLKSKTKKMPQIHFVIEFTAHEDPNFEVNSSIKLQWARKIFSLSLKEEPGSNSIHYINTKNGKNIRSSKITKVIHNMLCIQVMDVLQAFIPTCVYVWECMCRTTCGWFLLLVFEREDLRERENCWDFGRSTVYAASASRLRWLDGQQAAKFEVLDHRKLLQTLRTGRENRERLSYKHEKNKEKTWRLFN